MAARKPKPIETGVATDVPALVNEPHLTDTQYLAGEPDAGPLDAPAEPLIPVVSMIVPCPDCEWCGGLVALLTMGGETVAISYDAALEVGGHKHLVVGKQLRQVGTGGFASRKNEVCVGPCHPMYVALNLAYQAGETVVEAQGASPELQARLRLHLSRVKTPFEVRFT